MKAVHIAKFKFKVMFEKRPIWGLILGLNVCVLIWLISVQEPVIFDVNTAALSSSSSGSSNNYITNTNTASEQEAASPVAVALQQAQQHGKYGLGRDLLSNHLMSAQSNEYDDSRPSAAVSNLTTLNFNNINNSNNKNNNYKTNNSNNINKSTKTSKQSKFSHNFYDVTTTTTKTSDLSSNIQKLTSSLGTGVLNLKRLPTPSWTKLAAVASALPAADFNQLIDLQNFQFLLPQPVCSNHIAALILVHSAPKNYEKRQTVRETWASITHHTAESPLRVIFLLGAVSSETLQDDIENENNVYHDIVQGSFIDDYHNMTYKHVMALKWFLYNCSQAQILIKVDDDVYVNTPQLIKYLKYQRQQQQQQQHAQQIIMNNTYNDNPTIATSMTKTKTKTKTTNTNTTKNVNTTSSSTTNFFSKFSHNFNIFSTPPAATLPLPPTFNASHDLFNYPKNLLFCQKKVGAAVKRSFRSKWRVSFKAYRQRYYPPYCPGYAIIYSPDVIYRLYTAAQNSNYFWIDDVQITGVLAQQTNTTITNSSHYVLFSNEFDQIVTGKTDLSEAEFLFAWHSVTSQQIKFLWHLQMIAPPALEQFNYKKNTMNDGDGGDDDDDDDDDVVNDQKMLTKNDDEYSSSYSYTSANGFR